MGVPGLGLISSSAGGRTAGSVSSTWDNQHVRVPIITVQLNPKAVVLFPHLEGGVVMNAGE